MHVSMRVTPITETVGARWEFDIQEVQNPHSLGDYLQGNPLKCVHLPHPGYTKSSKKKV